MINDVSPIGQVSWILRCDLLMAMSCPSFPQSHRECQSCSRSLQKKCSPGKSLKGASHVLMILGLRLHRFTLPIPDIFIDFPHARGRHLGNESFSLWANVTLKASGSFRLCLLLRDSFQINCHSLMPTPRPLRLVSRCSSRWQSADLYPWRGALRMSEIGTFLIDLYRFCV